MALKFLTFQLPTGAALGKVLTSDGTGIGTWQVVPATDAGTFDGGTASTVWTGQPRIDCGAAN